MQLKRFEKYKTPTALTTFNTPSDPCDVLQAFWVQSWCHWCSLCIKLQTLPSPLWAAGKGVKFYDLAGCHWKKGINPSGKIHIQTYFQLLPLECFVLLFLSGLFSANSHSQENVISSSEHPRLLPVQKSLAQYQGGDRSSSTHVSFKLPYVATWIRSAGIRSSVPEFWPCALKAPCSMPTLSASRLESGAFYDWDRCFVFYDSRWLFVPLSCNVMRHEIYWKWLKYHGYPYNIMLWHWHAFTTPFSAFFSHGMPKGQTDLSVRSTWCVKWFMHKP